MSENRRPIRSFVRREGRMTPRQKRAFEQLWSNYGRDLDDGYFVSDKSLILEIGFGMGQSLLEMAMATPQNQFIGVEVHRPGVGSLIAFLEEQRIDNVVVYCEDVTAVLRDCIADNSLQKIMIFFPDPWSKKRHHKRRLIQPNFVVGLSNKLKIGGILHIATDWQNYAEHIGDVMETQNNFENLHDTAEYKHVVAQRPETKFERRGLNLGHQVWDFVYKNVG